MPSPPGGRVEIRGQELQPGERVLGSLVFYITKGSVTTFTITYYGTATELAL